MAASRSVSSRSTINASLAAGVSASVWTVDRKSWSQAYLTKGKASLTIRRMNLVQALPRRLTRPVFLWAAAALATEILVKSSGAPPVWATLLPLLPMLGFIVSLALAIHRMDELQQRISVVSMAVAFVLALVLTLAFISVERLGVYAPHWNEMGTYMLALWACAYALLSWRYR